MTPLAVAFVVRYLAVMVINGAPPTQRQFVEFQANGVLKTPPELIRRVELVRADQRLDPCCVRTQTIGSPGRTHVSTAPPPGRSAPHLR